MGFQMICAPNGHQCQIRFFGNLDEDAILEDLSDKKFEEILIDFEQFKSINSVGIRSLLQWFTSLQSVQMTFIKCPKFLIDQFNMVMSLKPKNAIIESFFVPYFEEDSEEERLELYYRGVNFFKNQAGKIELMHPQVLSKNGKPMSLDVQSRYFNFLNQ